MGKAKLKAKLAETEQALGDMTMRAGQLWTTLTEAAVRRSVDLTQLSREMRANSERWFPAMHENPAIPMYVFYAMGHAGEAGETLDEVKKTLRGGGPILDGGHLTAEQLGKVGAEMADSFTYLLLLAGELGIDLPAEYALKRDINEDRWGDNPEPEIDDDGGQTVAADGHDGPPIAPAHFATEQAAWAHRPLERAIRDGERIEFMQRVALALWPDEPDEPLPNEDLLIAGIEQMREMVDRAE